MRDKMSRWIKLELSAEKLIWLMNSLLDSIESGRIPQTKSAIKLYGRMSVLYDRDCREELERRKN